MTKRILKRKVHMNILRSLLSVFGFLTVFLSCLSWGATKLSSEKLVNQPFMELSGIEKYEGYSLLSAKVFYPTECYDPKENIVHKTDDSNNVFLFHFSVIDENLHCPQVIQEQDTVFVLPEMEDGVYNIYSGNQEELLGTISIEGSAVSVAPTEN